MPVKYIGSTAPESDLYGVSHWPMRTDPQLPARPMAVLRDAMLLPPASTATPDSIWKNAESAGPIFSLPRKPRLDEFCVTRLRTGTFAPVGVKPSEPAGRVPAAVALRASTVSK